MLAANSYPICSLILSLRVWEINMPLKFCAGATNVKLRKRPQIFRKRTQDEKGCFRNLTPVRSRISHGDRGSIENTAFAANPLLAAEKPDKRADDWRAGADPASAPLGCAVSRCEDIWSRRLCL